MLLRLTHILLTLILSSQCFCQQGMRLDIPAKVQCDSVWCWAACMQMMVNYFKPKCISCPTCSTGNIKQCEIVQVHEGLTSTDCCSATLPETNCNLATYHFTLSNSRCAPSFNLPNLPPFNLKGTYHVLSTQAVMCGGQEASDIDFNCVKSQINGNHPICVEHVYNSGQGHVLLVVGYEDCTDGDFVYVNDPWVDRSLTNTYSVWWLWEDFKSGKDYPNYTWKLHAHNGRYSIAFFYNDISSDSATSGLAPIPVFSSCNVGASIRSVSPKNSSGLKNLLGSSYNETENRSSFKNVSLKDLLNVKNFLGFSKYDTLDSIDSIPYFQISDPKVLESEKVLKNIKERDYKLDYSQLVFFMVSNDIVRGSVIMKRDPKHDSDFHLSRIMIINNSQQLPSLIKDYKEKYGEGKLHIAYCYRSNEYYTIWIGKDGTHIDNLKHPTP